MLTRKYNADTIAIISDSVRFHLFGEVSPERAESQQEMAAAFQKYRDQQKQAA